MAARRFTEAEVIAAIRETRGILLYTAQRLGVSRQAIQQRAVKNAAIREALAEEREKFVDRAEFALLKKFDEGDTASIIFTLKTLGKSRGYVERQDGDLPGGSSIRRIVIEEVHYGDGDAPRTLEPRSGDATLPVPRGASANLGT